MLTGWLIVLAAMACLVVGAPLFTALGVVTLACVYFLGDGFLVTEGTIARRLVAAAQAWFGWLPAGLAVTAVTACIFFAAISGSSAVTLIAVGSILYPALGLRIRLAL